MHGLDLDASDFVEVGVPLKSGIRYKDGLSVRHLIFEPGDVTTIRGLRVTAIHRTLRDLCVRVGGVEALVAVDMALRLRRTTKQALRSYVNAAAPLPGAGRLRRLLAVAEPAESPMETRLRWLLSRRGMPRPEVQVPLADADGRFVARADLYYAGARLVVEFDGGNHRDRLVEDDRRQNALVNAGFRVLRFTAGDVYQSPELTIRQVRAALKTARAQPSRFDQTVGVLLLDRPAV